MNPRLRDMLTYKRPYGSKSEADWIKRFIMPYEPAEFGTASETMMYIVRIEHPDGSAPNVLFSAHTDTVHRKPGRQKLVVDEAIGFVSKNDGEPLGADDAAGVWLLLEMIDAKVPGVYSFPVGEECGGIGSKWFARAYEPFLAQFDYAIAFDRKATDSIITHQGCGMCCSQAFASALGNALNDLDERFMYSPDDTGVYTDTAEYVDIIAECTNVSCGYYDEHTGKERLDFKHLERLRDACVKLDWKALPVSRKPGEDDYVSTWRSAFKPSRQQTIYDMTRNEMIEFACDFPDEFVDLIRDELGIEDDYPEIDDTERDIVARHFRKQPVLS